MSLRNWPTKISFRQPANRAAILEVWQDKAWMPVNLPTNRFHFPVKALHRSFLLRDKNAAATLYRVRLVAP